VLLTELSRILSQDGDEDAITSEDTNPKCVICCNYNMLFLNESISSYFDEFDNEKYDHISNNSLIANMAADYNSNPSDVLLSCNCCSRSFHKGCMPEIIMNMSDKPSKKFKPTLDKESNWTCWFCTGMNIYIICMYVYMYICIYKCKFLM